MGFSDVYNFWFSTPKNGVMVYAFLGKSGLTELVGAKKMAAQLNSECFNYLVDQNVTDFVNRVDSEWVWLRVYHNGSISNPPLRELEDAVRKLQVDQNNGSLVSYPDFLGELDNIHYLRTGQCGYKSNCKFNHPSFVGHGETNGEEFPESVWQPDCMHYLKTGTYKYRLSCKYYHPADRNGAGQVLYNTWGLPLRQEEKSCLSVVQFSSPPFAPGPPLQGFQNYEFVIVSSQSMVSSNGWNTYLGCHVPVLGSDLSYYKNVVELGYSSIHPLSSTINSYLPERPDKPECRNYLSTENYKYGSSCKYHHPWDRAPQWTAYTLGPLGQ
ncbi:zinc finger CCCH domain-containing protein 3-like [Impatiens glandulifera]|uniref:zinc finger CCCH domain-containing protein 3-like n=1 Tax=Impatiens glandulifera TaxID=253017 RepID=UPI001FB0A597|nr:zinc finger CCCH domain-containing protein 3-like [Impatiens glandulifera]